MDWFTPETLKGVAGASAAVTLVVAIIKTLTGLAGRWVQLAAFVLSVIISVSTVMPGTFAEGLLCLLNGCVVYAASVGIDQTFNYKKGVQ